MNEYDNPTEANPQGTEEATPDVATTEVGEPEVTPAEPVDVVGDRLAKLEQANAEKDKYIGKMQMEVGESRKMIQQEAQRRAELEQYLEQQANPPRDFDAELEQLAAQVDDGLPQGDALKIAAQISYERAMAEGEQRTMSLLQQEQQRNKMQEMEQSFLAKFPDYPDFLESGERDKLAQEHPFFNDGPLAYLEFKRREEAAKGGMKLEEGKRAGTEETKRLLQGTGKGQQVLQDPVFHAEISWYYQYSFRL